MEIDRGRPQPIGKLTSHALGAMASFMTLTVWSVRLRWFSNRTDTSVVAKNAHVYSVVPGLWSAS